MVLISVDPPWLHTIGQIAGVLLLLELGTALLVTLIFAGALAFGVWWLREHVVPVLEQVSGQARQVMEFTTQGTDRIAKGVAEFHGRKQAVQTIIRVLLFGKQSARAIPVAPVGSAQRGMRRPLGSSPVEGFAPADLPTDPTLSSRDISAADLTPLTRGR